MKEFFHIEPFLNAVKLQKLAFIWKKPFDLFSWMDECRLQL
jgi:hypothetical protein